MTDKSTEAGVSESWSPETLLVHGGTLRSPFGETSEALFLTQSFVYANAEQAEARFKDEDPGFIYSRFSNPTVGMFEERMRLLEGAEAARATATGMAAVTSALLCFLKAGDHIVAARAMFGSCLYVAQELCPRFGIACTLVDGRDTASLAARRAAQHQGVLLRDAGQSHARPRRHRRRVARSRTQPAPSSSSTTCSPRPCCRSR